MPDPQAAGRSNPSLTVRTTERGSPLVTTSIILVSLVVLYLGAGILVPLVLAVLLAFALAPLIRRLRRLHLPHIVAVLLAVLLAGAVLSTIGYVIATQLIKLASDLPSYQATVMAKTQALQNTLGDGGFIESLAGALDSIRSQFAGAAATGTTAPTPVTITNGGAGPLDIVQTVLGSVLGPLATAAIVLVFLIFLLLEREDLRDRFLKLVSRGDLRTSTKVMNEAAARVGRYLLVQFGVNLSYGVLFAIGLSIIGVPNAILWGLLAAMFRYIPFVGTIIAATIPFTLAFAVDPGWSMLLSAVALYAGLELVITNAIEPRLYGSSTGLSAIAVLIAAMFWATLWGPIGLILSTPMTVCLVVLGRYIPRLAFFETLLGSEPVLTPTEKFYQRLVSANVEEAIELAEEHVGQRGATDFYKVVAMPALSLAETDLSLDVADLSPRRNVADCIGAVIEDIDIEQDQEVANLPAKVLCIGGRTELDEAAAQILTRLLRAKDLPAKSATPLAIRQESIGQLDLETVEVVCLCYLGSNPRSYVRFVSKRLARLKPGLKIMAVAMGQRADAMTDDWGADQVVASVDAALSAIDTIVMSKVSPTTDRAGEPMVDDAGLDRLRRLALSDGPMAGMLQQIARSADVPVAVMDIAGGEREARPEGIEGGGDNLASAISRAVIARKKSIVLESVATDPLFANDQYLLENGIRFYAGVPLVGSDGTVIGVLALLDYKSRSFSASELEALELQALKLMVQLNAVQAA